MGLLLLAEPQSHLEEMGLLEPQATTQKYIFQATTLTTTMLQGRFFLKPGAVPLDWEETLEAIKAVAVEVVAQAVLVPQAGLTVAGLAEIRPYKVLLLEIA